MAVICSTYHSTRDFSYQADTKTLVIEESTLRGNSIIPTFGRVYDDACDEGFVLVSHKTGDSITFAVDKVDMNEGDVAGWHLIPLNKNGRRDTTKDFTVLVIND